MNMNINFGQAQKSAVSVAGSRIKPWTITEVVFEGIKYEVITGKDGSTYEVAKVKFTSEDGDFETSFFGPTKQEDLERRPKPSNPDAEFPSAFETVRYNLNHIIYALDNTLLEKVEKALSGKSTTFKSYIELISKACSKYVGNKLFLKLVSNKKGYAQLPNILYIKEKGAEIIYISNFVSKDKKQLSFSEYELNQKDKIEKATPTNMSVTSHSSDELDVVEEASQFDNLDSDMPF